MLNPNVVPIIYRDVALPSSPTASNEGIWMVKANNESKFRLYVINSMGVVVEIDAVTAAQLALKADDDSVVKLTGNQTIDGVKTYKKIPVLPSDNPTSNNQATHKKYVDQVRTDMTNLINDLENIVAEGTRVPEPLDCSSNPNYPASERGDVYRVTAEGKVGGTSGELVEVNDTIYCLESNSGGTQSSVGSKFYIVQGNTDKATTSTHGTVKLATPAEVSSGSTTGAIPTIADVITLIENNVEEYTAGPGLTLTGKEFSLPVTVSGSGTYVTKVEQTTGGLKVTMGTPTTYSKMSQSEINGGTATSARVVDAKTLHNWLFSKGFLVEADIAWGAQAW